MTTVIEVVDAITRHHGELTDALTDRVEAVVTAVRTGAPYDEPVAQLRRLLADDVVPHARAEEEVLYAVAATAVAMKRCFAAHRAA